MLEKVLICSFNSYRLLLRSITTSVAMTEANVFSSAKFWQLHFIDVCLRLCTYFNF